MLNLNDEKTLEETEESSEQVVDVEEASEEIVIEENNEKSTRYTKPKKENKVAKATKGAFSELKKVSWLNFKGVVKQTIVVLSVTVVFLVLIFGIDQLLSLLRGLLTKNMGG